MRRPTAKLFDAPTVHLVVTCAKSKRQPVAAALRLRSVPVSGIPTRAECWLRQLSEFDAEAVPATDLYAGGHWAAARTAGKNADRAWVASAGYGLIPFDAPIRSYSATFQLGDPDSVVPPAVKSSPTAPSEWWDALARWEGPVPGQPRRVAELAAEGAFVLVAVSVPYLRAMTPDLLAANGRAPGRVAVLCAGANRSHPLAACLLPADAGLQPLVGGALVSLNARLAGHLLANPPAEWTFAAARDRMAEWQAGLPEREAVVRRGVDDEEVVGFIRRQFTADHRPSATALLRTLRRRGLACESKRFARLHRVALEA